MGYIRIDSEEALPIRSEQWQNTEFSRNRHWKCPQKKRWEDNIREWTGLEFAKS